MVSKAIVQAVEQQGGRFLERSRKDGFWYSVPYKRAVDKTSQGLRERERDDEAGAPPMAVPHQFSGQAPHKLSDLADVAIAHATRMDGLPRTASELIGASGYRPAVVAPAPPSSRGPAPPMRGPPPLPPPRSAVPSPRTSAPPPPRSAVPPASAQPQRLETKDFAPLPPTLEPRQSSMFRLLKDTKLLPAESTFVMGPNTPQVGYSRAVAAAAAAKQEAAAPHAGMQYGVSPAPPPYAYGAAAAAPPAPPPSAGAPALTRLTSQVSDWLNSFWPVPARGESAAAAPGGGGAFARGYGAPPAAAAAAPPKGVAPAIQMIPPPEPQGPIQINTIPPMMKPSGAEAQQPQRASQQGSPHYAAAAAKQSAYQDAAAAKMEPTTAKPNENRAANEACNDDAKEAAGRPSLAPTELEHSVSATLLKLATTPSRFFSGISALFDEDEPRPPVAVSTETSASAATVKTGNSPPPIVAGTKRSKASLLDDDDSGDEAAAVFPVKKRRTSLLDDYEESPREARMRNVYD